MDEIRREPHHGWIEVITGSMFSGKSEELIRRLRRDMTERGRTVDAILRQYEDSVRPMYLEFVEPSKRFADVIIPRGGHNKVAIDLVKTKIRELLRERGVDVAAVLP